MVKEGQISETRINTSVKRVLRDKFRLGLFDNPYVDERKAALIAGNDEFRIKGKVAQGRSTILLKNEGILPLKEGTKVYAEGIDDISELEKYGYVVDTPEEADVIVKRLWTPFDERDGLIEQFFHQGRLYYTDEELREILNYWPKNLQLP